MYFIIVLRILSYLIQGNSTLRMLFEMRFSWLRFCFCPNAIQLLASTSAATSISTTAIPNCHIFTKWV